MLLVLVSAAKGDEFFGDQLSVREKHASESSLERLTAFGEGISVLLSFWEYQAFAEGRCDGYFEVETAAKNGDSKSQYLLSDLYRNGYCVPQDDARALQWVRKAAEGGYEPAYFDFGYFLFQGIGAEKNPGAALPWLEMATPTRIEAYFFLAMIYLDGQGVRQNYEKSHDYALRGAQLGDPSAQSVAAMLGSHSGFEFTNHVDAYKWALIAKSSGRPNIVKTVLGVIAELEKTLTPQQINRAQNEALEWEPVKLESAATADPTVIDLPTLDSNTVLNLSRVQANARLIALGLERDRFLFFKAIAEDNVGVTALYVRAGASPETVSPTLFVTPLLHAASNGSERVARFLVSEGSDIDRSLNSGNDTPVLLALSRGHRRLAEFLISKGANLDHPGIMYSAVKFNDPTFLALLVAKGVSIDQDYVGTPLSNAVSAVTDTGKRRCHEKSAAFLIERGARLDVRDVAGDSLLQLAVGAENPVGCVSVLLQGGASQMAPSGQEPLFGAVISGNSEVVRLLLQNGADPNLRFELDAGRVPWILSGDAKSTVMHGGSLLQLAVAEQHAAIARILVQHGADKDAADNLGRTPLSIAEKNADSLLIAVLKGEM